MEEAIALDSIQAIAASFGASFDAEKIVDTVVEKDGTRYYKVRWIKYSWEPAASFTHLEHLIRSFWNQYNASGQFQQILDVNKKQQTIQPSQVYNHVETDNTVDKTIPQILNNVNPVVENLETVQVSQNINNQQQNGIEQTFTSQQLQTVAEGTVVGSSHQHHMDIISNLQALPLPLATEEVPNIENDNLLTVNKKQPDTIKKRRKIPGTCDICGKQFKSTTNVAAHKKLHTEERPFECTQCGRKFRRKLHLTRHLKSHAGIKSFSCDICGSKFSSKWYMQSHKIIHTGDKPFECQLCGKRFNNKANFNKHKQIHANKRPFVCNLCGQTYRQSYDLKRHMSTHSNSKAFACTQCGKSFARKSYLQRHMLTHDSDRKFQCTLCDRRFLQRGHLNFHLKKHTNFVDKTNDQTDDLTSEKLNPPIDAVEVFLNHPEDANTSNRNERTDASAANETEQNITPVNNLYQETLMTGKHDFHQTIMDDGTRNVSDKENTLEFATSEGQNDFIL